MDLFLPKNIKIGEAEDAYTGCTVILAPKGATAGVDVRGNAPGTRETDLLKDEKTVCEVNAVVLTGGSAFGLASASGVVEFCREKGWGYKASNNKKVPIVSSAVIFDLNDKDYHYPTAEMGEKACKNAFEREPEFGQHGVGKGATLGKIRGMKNCQKSGVGAASVKCGNINVSAIVCVNAFGDVWENGKIIAGAKNADGTFFDTEACLAEGKFAKIIVGSNTTIGCVITDANLDKLHCNKLASIAHNGYARTIRPVHTDYDGDTIFALSSGSKPVLNFAALQAATVRAVEQAVLNAVRSGVGYSVLYTEE